MQDNYKETRAKSKKFVRYADGAELYSMSVSKFMQLAKDAKACYKVNQLDGSKRSNQIYELDSIRYLREETAADIFGLPYSTVLYFAQAAGAVYKINEGTGGTVLVNLEIFDEYMEQFREEPREMKNPLWKPDADL